jgi:hypothetical protein
VKFVRGARRKQNGLARGIFAKAFASRKISRSSYTVRVDFEIPEAAERINNQHNDRVIESVPAPRLNFVQNSSCAKFYKPAVFAQCIAKDGSKMAQRTDSDASLVESGSTVLRPVVGGHPSEIHC